MKEYAFILIRPNFTYKIEFRNCNSLKDAKKIGEYLLASKNYNEVNVCEVNTLYPLVRVKRIESIGGIMFIIKYQKYDETVFLSVS